MLSAILSNGFKRSAQACADVAGAALVALMLITVVDIVARRFGLFSVRGIIEISTMAVVLIAFLALPHSFIMGGHIVVDLATSHLSDRISRRIDAIWLGVSGVCLTFLAYLMWRATYKAYQDASISLDIQLPMVIFWLPATVGMSLAPVACVIALYRNWNELGGAETATDRGFPRE